MYICVGSAKMINIYLGLKVVESLKFVAALDNKLVMTRVL